MLNRRRLLSTLPTLMLSGSALAADVIPSEYKLVWSDEFETFSVRAGGRGTWVIPGACYGDDPRGAPANGYDWFVNPSYRGWPSGYHGPVALTSEGLRIRSESRPDIAKTLPKVKGVQPWLSGQVNSIFSVRIKPPFYFEARAKMPMGVGQPFPAIWLITDAHNSCGELGVARREGEDYEVDVHEGYGDSDHLHSAIAWNHNPARPNPTKLIANVVVDDLSTGFNTWGCHITTERQTTFFNGREVGQVETPETGNPAQYFNIVLDVSAGIPWEEGGGLPSGGPHDMIVRYVKLYARDNQGLILR